MHIFKIIKANIFNQKRSIYDNISTKTEQINTDDLFNFTH